MEFTRLEAIKQEDNEANEGVFFPTIDIPLRCLCFLLFIGRRFMSICSFIGKRSARQAHEKTRIKTLCAIRVIRG